MTDENRAAVPPEGPRARRVVLAPDLVASAFAIPECAQVLTLWRDGRIRPALNRQLLLRYLKLLRQIGIPEVSLRRWSWWLTSPRTAVLIEETFDSGLNARRLCSVVASRAQAECVVCVSSQAVEGGPQSDPPAIQWIPAGEFLGSFQREGD